MQETEDRAGKIIFVPFIDGFGGVERLVLSLSRYLHERALPHRILCFRDSIDLDRFADWPVRITKIESARNSITESFALRNWIERSKSSRSSGEPFLVFDLRGAFYAASTSRPYVLHLTDPPSLLPADESKYAPSLRGSLKESTSRPRSLPRLARAQIVHWVNSRGVRKAKRVIAMSQSIAAEIRLLYGIDAEIVRPGVKPGNAALRSTRSGNVSILSVSRLEESKRISWVLNALAHLEQSIPPLHSEMPWRFEIVGDGPARASLVSLTESLGLSDRVTFHGRISDDALEKCYSTAGIFIMPAVQGYGLPALEALTRHVPVIMHRASGVSEILGGTPWVELIQSDTGEDVAPAIRTMMQRISTDALSSHPVPEVPTEGEWAARICEVCGWN